MFTTKHHDGFCMFDTRQTDYRTTAASCPSTPNPRANVVASVFDAFRGQGFGIGAYFSKADWHHRTTGAPKPAAPRPQRELRHPPKARVGPVRRFTHPQIEELMTGYGPVDILWLDAGQVRPPQQDIDMRQTGRHGTAAPAGNARGRSHRAGRYENYRTPSRRCPPNRPLTSGRPG